MGRTDNFANSAAKKGKYDPVKRAEEVAAVVCRDDQRKYYRFRPARFYDGIATADCVGCCLRCIFCWSWREVVRPDAFGQYYSPQEVASKLTKIARKKRFRQMRISGNEPSIAREHLIKVLELIPPDIHFILETNGILIGHDRTFAEDLARFDNLYVRVSLKGTNEEEFSRLTGAEPTGFALQLQALENLHRFGVDTHPAVMVSFSLPKNVRALRKQLAAIDGSFEDMEIEELVQWGDVEERLRKARIGYRKAHHPEAIPPEQV
ncbi:MAG: radical SAM protein [Candidatus Hydrogenedentota bacterium]|nr:MAG: radical SAM protein [Candidatus Hydrogenedentota bacterium]